MLKAPRLKEIEFEKIGLYTNQFRKTLPIAGDFNLIYPQNKQKNVVDKDVILDWEACDNALYYDVTIATDKDFTNIIKNEKVSNTSFKIENLPYDAQTYYWKVIANDIPNAISRPFKTGIASFTRGTKQPVSLHDIKYIIKEAKALYSSTKEGAKGGQYQQGSKQDLKNAIDKVETVIKQKNLTSEMVSQAQKDLEVAFNTFDTRKVQTVVNLKSFINKPEKWKLQNNAVTFKAGVMRYARPGDVNVIGGLDEKFENSDILNFNMNIEFDDANKAKWTGIGISAANTIFYAWQGNRQYLIIFKPDAIELHKYNMKFETLKTYPNNVIKSGNWYNVKLSARNTLEGTHVIMEVDGTNLVDFLDKTDPIKVGGNLMLYGCGVPISLK